MCFALLVPIECQSVRASPSIAAPHATPTDATPAGDPQGVKAAATQVLRHLYAVYLGIRTCEEVASELGRVGADTVVGLGEARRVLRAIDPAAAKAGIDVRAVWSEEAPSGLVTAEALRPDTLENRRTCRRLGSVFRIDAANLQSLLARLGTPAELVRKDY